VSDIQPELWVEHPSEAIVFYQAAFGAVVAHRVGGSEDIVAREAVGNARFWIANADAEKGRCHPSALGGSTSRTLLVVDDPDAFVAAASGAGATVPRPSATSMAGDWVASPTPAGTGGRSANRPGRGHPETKQGGPNADPDMTRLLKANTPAKPSSHPQ
jgi:uncharacterized glyoxalase superfamily protein PhnB